jgi:hypothetical protein
MLTSYCGEWPSCMLFWLRLLWVQCVNKQSFGLFFFMSQGWHEAVEELLSKTAFLAWTNRYKHDETRPVTSRSMTKLRAYSTRLAWQVWPSITQSSRFRFLLHTYIYVAYYSCTYIHISQNEESIFQLDVPFIELQMHAIPFNFGYLLANLVLLKSLLRV